MAKNKENNKVAGKQKASNAEFAEEINVNTAKAGQQQTTKQNMNK